jgi:hypothetical protein
MARIDHDVFTEAGPYPALANVKWRVYASGGYVAPRFAAQPVVALFVSGVAGLARVDLPVYDSDRAPVSGLAGTETWRVIVDVATGLPVAPPAPMAELVDGLYSLPPKAVNGAHVAGIVNFGVSASPQFQWQLFDCPTSLNDDLVFILRDPDTQEPLAGLAATAEWLDCHDVATGIQLSPPVVRELGYGLYAVPATAVAGQHISGLIYFGTTSSPLYATYDVSRPAAVPAVGAPPAGWGAPVAVTQADVDYGTDFLTEPDLSWTPTRGYLAIAQALVRSLQDAQEGVDLQDQLNDDTGVADLFALEQRIRTQCLADERLANASVTVTPSGLMAVQVDIEAVPADGSKPFKLVLSISNLTVTLLSVESSP